MLMEKLIQGIITKKSPIVVGLDPVLDSLPEEVLQCAAKEGRTFEETAAAAIEAFNCGIIDAVCDLVPAVKPQVAFYEQFGPAGMQAYRNTCVYAESKGLVVIGDIKRGDIGSTSRAYSNAHLGQVGAGAQYCKGFPTDIITVNPYLGDDCLKEFMDDVKQYDKGLFILVKTSNPTSSQLQNLISEGKPIYEHVAAMVNRWTEETVGPSGYSPVGAVVGATYPSEAERLRQLMPKAYFLVPGYGAQGGGGADVVPCFNNDGLGALVNSSRGIIFAWKKDKFQRLTWQESAREAVKEMQLDINSALESAGKAYWKVFS